MKKVIEILRLVLAYGRYATLLYEILYLGDLKPARKQAVMEYLRNKLDQLNISLSERMWTLVSRLIDAIVDDYHIRKIFGRKGEEANNADALSMELANMEAVVEETEATLKDPDLINFLNSMSPESGVEFNAKLVDR